VPNVNLTWLRFLLLSASILSFEVVATRIASVVFISDFAFVIISVGILGLGGGAWFAHMSGERTLRAAGSHSRLFLLLGASLCVFALAVTLFSITSPFLFFPLLLLPFLIGGMLSASLYSGTSGTGYSLYASDLSGAVIGSLLSLAIINLVGATNAVLLVAVIAWGGSAISWLAEGRRGRGMIAALLVVLAATAILINRQREVLGEIAIGRHPAKDFYSVYPDAALHASIIDSRWSIFGRADLVAYNHQNAVMQLFVDGAAGSQVYRFNGNVKNTGSNLQGLLLQHTNAIPFLCLDENEKRSMLVIGPGGGKDVLLGLFGGVQRITGVEVNPDFVQIVKDHREFDGGIYTDFPNVHIVVDEGRHYVRRAVDSVDLVVMALPSTAQMQNIEPYAANENFLLTREALSDYFRILTPRGALILTVHNQWELERITVTAVSLFHDAGIPPGEIPDHFVLCESEYAPTVVIKKNAFSLEESIHWQETCRMLPGGFPRVTYLPHGVEGTGPSRMSSFMKTIAESPVSLRAVVAGNPLNIAPCTDDSPYFYNVSRWGPGELYGLLGGVIVWCIAVVGVPLVRRRVRGVRVSGTAVWFPLFTAIAAGAGFMILEISLLQRLVLWLGGPTTSLAILLAILLAGMGIGSMIVRAFDAQRRGKLLAVAVVLIAAAGVLHNVYSSVVLQQFMHSAFVVRLLITGMLLLPLAVVLGVPFPLALQVLRVENRGVIPWFYAVNCSFSVLGSIIAIVISVVWGFGCAFGVGLVCYLLLGIPAVRLLRDQPLSGEVAGGK
jgi:hypothetical protein